MIPLALSSGGLVMVAFAIVLVAAVVYGQYSRSGSDIAQRPSDGLDHGEQAGAPGAGGPDRLSGSPGEGEQDRFDTHGTR